MNRFIFSAKLFITIGLMSIIGCTTEKEKSVTLENQSASFQLFEVLSPETTGLTFNNLINESPAVNGVLYEYLYNGGGVAAGDFNNDGWQDLFFTSNLNQDEIYLNKGSFQFQRVTAQAKLRGNKGFSTGVTTVDINNDGLLDIYVCKSGNYDDTELLKNELFINLGINSDGVPTFEERASDYGLDISDHSTQAAFFDYDRDGDLDMFLLNHGIDPAETEPNIDRLLLQKSKHSSNKLFKKARSSKQNCFSRSYSWPPHLSLISSLKQNCFSGSYSWPLHLSKSLLS